MNRPKTSFTVVINGPVASAGSILFRYKNIGIKVPKRAAKIITVRSDTLTEIANKKPSSNGKKSKMVAKINNEHINPFIIATINSFNNLLSRLFAFKELLANP